MGIWYYYVICILAINDSYFLIFLDIKCHHMQICVTKYLWFQIMPIMEPRPPCLSVSTRRRSRIQQQDKIKFFLPLTIGGCMAVHMCTRWYSGDFINMASKMAPRYNWLIELLAWWKSKYLLGLSDLGKQSLIWLCQHEWPLTNIQRAQLT
jgi:hypothetical protein